MWAGEKIAVIECETICFLFGENAFFVLDLVKCSVARLLSSCHKQWPIFSVLWWNNTVWRRPVPKEASSNLMRLSLILFQFVNETSVHFFFFFFFEALFVSLVRFSESISTWPCCRDDKWVNPEGKFCANNFHVILGPQHMVLSEPALLQSNIVILLWEATRASLTVHHFSAL